MKDVKYFAPENLQEAVGLLAEYGPGAKVLAGGTDLTPRINYYEQQPDMLLFVGKLGLDYIKEEGERVVIGAAVTTAKLAGDELIAAKAPALSAAACQSGGPAIRTTATIGGNLANASPAADLATPLLALDAEVKITGPKGDRIAALADFFTGPGETVLAADEILVEVSFPAAKGPMAFVKLGRRKAMTLSVVNTAVQLVMDGDKIGEARVALGAMAPKPMRCSGAEAALKGQTPAPALFEEAAAKAISESSPIDDQRATAWYRRQAGRAVVARALAQAAGLSA